MMSIKIVEVKHTDDETIKALASLLINVVDDGASIGFLSPLSEKKAISYWREAIEEHVKLWIATYNNVICGTIQLQLCTKENGLHRAEVAKLIVHSEYRRLGIAKKLLESAEQGARINNRTLLVLDTREGDPSNMLYLKAGYIKAGKIPQFALSSNGQLDATVIYYKTI